MIKQETRTETYERVRTVSITCDLCGATSHLGDSWGADVFTVLGTEVKLEQGHRYPEGGNITTTRIDICPTCFVEKLVPWVEQQGGRARVDEVDL